MIWQTWWAVTQKYVEAIPVILNVRQVIEDVQVHLNFLFSISFRCHWKAKNILFRWCG